jgi:hypothetical protein
MAEIPTYKNYLIKSKNVKWKPVEIKNVEDGKMDFILTIPLTEMFDNQAKAAFMGGVLALFKFAERFGSDKDYGPKLIEQMEIWGFESKKIKGDKIG